MRAAGWLRGIGVLGLVGVLVLIVVMMASSLNSCSMTTGDIKVGGSIGPFELSGRDWCRSLARARPLVSVIDEATVGGDAFPIRVTEDFDKDTRFLTPPSKLRVDVAEVKAALEPGVDAAPKPNGYRIPPENAPAVRAAASRIDQYCDKASG